MGKATNAKQSRAQGNRNRKAKAGPGAPRREAIARKPCGRPANHLYEEDDRGSEMLRAKRAQVSGSDGVSMDFPLDIAEAREIITERQAKAGWDFAVLYWSCFGFPLGLGSIHRKLLSGVFGGGKRIDPGEHGTEKQKEAFREATQVLGRLGAGVPRQMIGLCCHFDGALLRHDQNAARAALSELDGLFSKGRGRKRQLARNIDRLAA